MHTSNMWMNRKRAVDFEDLPSNMGKFLDLGVLLVFKKLLIVPNTQCIREEGWVFGQLQFFQVDFGINFKLFGVQWRIVFAARITITSSSIKAVTQLSVRFSLMTTQLISFEMCASCEYYGTGCMLHSLDIFKTIFKEFLYGILERFLSLLMGSIV